MSLKHFHILFITLSTLMTVGFGLWSINSFRESGDAGYLMTSIGSFIVASGLVFYGVKFLKKMKDIK